MGLTTFLSDHREELINDWLEAVFKTYPFDTVGFLRRQKDQFVNPVAHQTEKGLTVVFDALVADGLDSDAVYPAMDNVIRVRAIQEFSPAQAVAVVYFIKTAVRNCLKKEQMLEKYAIELLEWESKVDSLALVTVNVYSDCRQVLFDMRIKEVKASQASLLRRAGMICDQSAEAPDTPNN